MASLAADDVWEALNSEQLALMDRLEQRYSALWEHPGCTAAQRWDAVDALAVRRLAPGLSTLHAFLLERIVFD